MIVSKKIYEYVLKLPEPLQVEVLNFVEFLMAKGEHKIGEQADREWANLSLAMAMRGMEEETQPYTLSDLKDTFS